MSGLAISNGPEGNAVSQCEAILRWLKRGRCLTPLDALRRFGCFRLAARIADLRGQGYEIESRSFAIGGKRVAIYRLR